jgi:predicted Zn-dependent protease
LLERLEKLWRSARRAKGARAVELYARSSLRLRVRAEGAGSAVVERGHDDGLAVRVVDPTGRIGFAAVSGIDSQAVDCALSEATLSAGPVIDPPWSEGGGGVSTDHDAPIALPETEALEAWLADAASGSRRPGQVAWVECGRTFEALVADGDLRATRQRNRAWGMGLVSFSTGDAIEERPRVVAARRLEDLPADLLTVKIPPSAPPLGLREAARSLPVVIGPQAASILVRALVQALCSPGRTGRTPVGAAFAVTEDPGHHDGLSGGRFDDAGFATQMKVLADGGFVSAADRGAGHYLRASYRDPPRPSFGTLVVADGEADMPGEALLIEHLRIHALDVDSWLMEVGAVVEEDGRPARPVRLGFARARPTELALRLHGAIGRARPCANGVITPALLLDGQIGE